MIDLKESLRYDWFFRKSYLCSHSSLLSSDTFRQSGSSPCISCIPFLRQDINGHYQEAICIHTCDIVSLLRVLLTDVVVERSRRNPALRSLSADTTSWVHHLSNCSGPNPALASCQSALFTSKTVVSRILPS